MSIQIPSRDELRANPEFAERYLATLQKAWIAKNPGPKYRTPGDLAKVITPMSVQTPALDLIDRALVEAYSIRDARLIISMPPQEGKSQRVTQVGTLWALLQNPERRFGIASYAQFLATRFGRNVRNWILQNGGQSGSLDLGLKIRRDIGAASLWQLEDHEGGVTSVGVQSSLTGIPVDALIIDDPFKDSTQADSLTFRDMVWDWWQSTATTRLAPGASVIVILTRWHEDDLAGRLLAAEDGHLWKVINIPAQADFDPSKGESDPLGRQQGEWLTSARGRTVAEWEAKRVAVGTKVFTALYQGRPSPESGNVWMRQWWRRFDTPIWSSTSDGRGWLIDCDEMLMSWDMTFKDTKSSDFVVGQVFARKGANVYLVDQVRARLSFTDTVTAFKNLVLKWPQCRVKLVEDKANGTAVMDSLRKEIAGIIPVEPHGSKYARASAVAPFIEAGNVLLPTSDIALFDVEGFIEETAGFPNAAHDDQVDGMSQALDRFFLRSGAGGAFLEYLKTQHDSADVETVIATVEVEPEVLTFEQQRQALYQNARR